MVLLNIEVSSSRDCDFSPGFFVNFGTRNTILNCFLLILSLHDGNIMLKFSHNLDQLRKVTQTKVTLSAPVFICLRLL